MANDGRAVPRIVVGVDGSESSVRALAWAVGQAEATGGVVEATIAWDIPPTYGFGPTVQDGEDLAEPAKRTLAAAVEAVEDASTARRDVEVAQHVLRGRAGAVLLDQSKDADLLVVGSHGHGPIVGSLLGSVSQQCVHEATCPVVVVRAA